VFGARIFRIITVDRNGRWDHDGRWDHEAPRHVALVSDGSGRWAYARGLSVRAGHEAAADTLRARLLDAIELGVRELTAYSFSTENWTRPEGEVNGLLQMFIQRIARETPALEREGVRMRFVGRRAGLPTELVDAMDAAEGQTSNNSTMKVFFAINYGGRADIVDAAARYRGGGEAEFRALLYAPDMHDPDVIIRTGRERRLSNFLLWQAAYAELVFRDELWPEFSRAAFAESLAEFEDRRRRYGGRPRSTRRGSAGAVSV
jgi:undecaprenyl diphosphate synthase